MKPQIALTPDLVHELQSLGLDCSDASMAWINLGGTYNNMLVLATQTNEVMQWYEGATYLSPAYTLEDILMKLPKYLYGEDGWKLIVTKSEVSYWHNATDCLHDCWGYTHMQNAFEMLKWVLKNHPDKIKKL